MDETMNNEVMEKELENAEVEEINVDNKDNSSAGPILLLAAAVVGGVAITGAAVYGVVKGVKWIAKKINLVVTKNNEPENVEEEEPDNDVEEEPTETDEK